MFLCSRNDNLYMYIKVSSKDSSATRGNTDLCTFNIFIVFFIIGATPGGLTMTVFNTRQTLWHRIDNNCVARQTDRQTDIGRELTLLCKFAN